MKKADGGVQVQPLVVDVEDVATMLCVCQRTVRNLTKRGELPVVRIAGRVLYRVEDVTEFVRQRVQKGSSGNSESADSTPNLE